MTPQEIIEEAIDYTSRPDLINNLIAIFPAILRKVHSIDTFNKDVEFYQVANPALLNDKYVAPIASTFPRLRKVISIATYDAYTGTGSEIDPFVGVNEQQVTWLQATSGRPLADYFGFIQAQTYYSSGGSFIMKGVQSSTKLIELETFSWPTWTYNELSDTYETSSWIAAEFPEIITANLKKVIAKISQQDDAIRSAEADLMLTQYDFIRAFTSEIYHGR